MVFGESEAGSATTKMNTQPEPTEDTLGAHLLQMIQTLQQDQLQVLQIVGRVIKEMEALDKRVQKLERNVRGNGD